MAEEIKTLLPMKAVMGWNDGVGSTKDANEIAKGYAARRFNALESSWYAVAPFMGGYLWEAHEGGQGKGYLDAAIKAFGDNPVGQFWFPCGDRVFQIMMRDGKPFGILLSKKDSDEVLASGQAPIVPSTKMKPVVRRGTAVLALGASMMAASTVFFLGSLIFYAVAANPGPSVAKVDQAQMPHSQWAQASSTTVEEIVSKLEFAKDAWAVEKRHHEIPGLNELREKTKESMEKLKAAIAPTPEIPAELQTPVTPAPETKTDDKQAQPTATPGGPPPPPSAQANTAEQEKERLRKLRTAPSVNEKTNKPVEGAK